MRARNSLKVIGLSSCAVLALALANPSFAQSNIEYELDIDAQSLASAIVLYGVQSGNEVLFKDSDVQGFVSLKLKGQFTAAEAIERLFAEANVPYRINADGTLIVGEAAVKTASITDPEVSSVSGGSDSQIKLNDAEDNNSGNATNPVVKEDPVELDELLDRESIEQEEEETKEQRGLLDKIVVYGSRNVGVRRYEDDAQPYVVFNSDDLRTSAASSLEEFFRTRLPQNAAVGTTQQFSNRLGEIGNTSSVNLRGLGAGQTLILVNGRRAPRVAANLSSSSDGGFNFQQADINGIPIASVERIEVLPATASGIYGGGATGGVINIITRRDFTGGEVQVQYGDTFEFDYEEYRIDGSYGFTLEDGKTNVLLTGSYAGAGELLAGERDFGRDSLNLLLANDPDSFFGQTTPPLGATPNIRSLFGNLILDDGTDLGSDITFVPTGYTGVASDGGQGLIDNAGSYNLNPAQDLNGALRPIRQSPEVYSYGISVSRDFTENLELFLDASFSSNEGQRLVLTTSPRVFMSGAAPGNPFQGFVSVNYPVPGVSTETTVIQENLSLIGGGTYKLPNDWVLSADYNWSRARSEEIGTTPGFDNFFGINPAIDAGTLNIFSDTSAFPLDLSPFAVVSPNNIVGPRDSVLRNLAVRLSGPVFELPAGSVNFAALLETREEVLEDYYIDTYNFFSGVPGNLNTNYIPEREQSTDSVYAELLIPVFSENNQLPFVQELDLQISGRFDDYSTQSPAAFTQFPVAERGSLPTDPIDVDRNEFDSFDYTLGLRYKVNNDLLLRGSYGTGFLPPSVGQIFRETRDNFFITGNDPKRGGETIFVQGNVQFGGNPDLVPEESESWSVGAIFTPQFMDGFRFSIDYSVIEKTDEILFANNQLILDNEDLLPGRVIRGDVTQADIDAGFDVGPVIGIDRSLVNFANTKSESLDIQIDQTFETDDYGDFRFFAIATHLITVEQQLNETSDPIDRVGFDNGPLSWRANYGLTWDDPSGAWTVGWNAQYYDSYRVYTSGSDDLIIDTSILQHGKESISAETYHDLFVAHRFDGSEQKFGGALENLELRVGIQNVFDKKPETRPGFSPTDGRFSVYGDNRLRRFTVAIRKGF